MATEQKHTPEPWSLDGFRLGPPIGPRASWTFATLSGPGDHGTIVADIAIADGARIVRCVNALAGIENPAAVRELIEACQSILNIEGPAIRGAQAGAYAGLDVGYHFDKVRAALAKLDQTDEAALHDAEAR